MPSYSPHCQHHSHTPGRQPKVAGMLQHSTLTRQAHRLHLQHRQLSGCSCRHARRWAHQQHGALHLQAAPSLRRCRAHSRHPSWIMRAGLGDEELDVAVFRFTLGIPGFDDRDIPRVVGLVIAALVIINHVLGAQPTPDAQARAELLDALLAALCFITPDIEDRLREAAPGRGRQQAAQSIAGAAQGFALAPAVDDASKKELAWSSFALLKNTNCCSAVLVGRGRAALMARGALGADVFVQGDAAGTLERITQDLASMPGALQGVTSGQEEQLWLPDRAAIAQVGAGVLRSIPSGVQSLLVQGLGNGRQGMLLAMSERPRGLSDKDRKWVAALARKVAACPALAQQQ